MRLTDDEIRTRVLDIVGRYARVDQNSLSLDTRIADLDIGSLDVVQILFEVEEALGTYLPPDSLTERPQTLRALVDGAIRQVAMTPRGNTEPS